MRKTFHSDRDQLYGVVKNFTEIGRRDDCIHSRLLPSQKTISCQECCKDTPVNCFGLSHQREAGTAGPQTSRRQVAEVNLRGQSRGKPESFMDEGPQRDEKAPSRGGRRNPQREGPNGGKPQAGKPLAGEKKLQEVGTRPAKPTVTFTDEQSEPAKSFNDKRPSQMGRNRR